MARRDEAWMNPSLRAARVCRRLAFAALSLACACAAPVRAGLPAEPPPAPVAPPAPSAFESAKLEASLRARPRLANVVEHAPDYRFQVLLSVPEMNGTGWRRREGFRVDAEYFYPASAIKPCIALAALEALGEMRDSIAPGLDLRATFTSERRRRAVTFGMLVSGSLISSDNDASDDLLDLVGFDNLHQRMWRMGLSSVRVRHRLGASTSDDGRSTSRVELNLARAGKKRSPVVITARDSTLELGQNEGPGLHVGAHFIEGGRLVDGPMSFAERNRISLVDLQDTMVAVMRPDLRAPDQRPRLGESERAAMIGALTTLPRSWGMDAATEIEHKPLLSGLERVRPRRALTIASKSGHAYGFVVANAYVVERKSRRSFFLTVALYTNANGRLNDDQYEYDSVAYPALAEVGEVAARNVFDDPS